MTTFASLTGKEGHYTKTVIPFVPIIITLIVAGLLYWLISLIPLPEPFPHIIRAVFVILVVLYLLSVFFGYRVV